MKSKPKEVAQKLAQFIQAWTSLRPTKSFLGMTLTEFKTALQPSVDHRQSLVDLQNQVLSKQDVRDMSDADTVKLLKRLVNAVKADPDEGEDSDFLEALGYVRASDRKSGLTRKTNGNGPASPPTPPTP